jgi:hypothetical protein
MISIILAYPLALVSAQKKAAQSAAFLSVEKKNLVF